MESTGEKPKLKNRGIERCCVPGCGSNNADNPGLAFHRFPNAKGRYVFITDEFGNKRKVEQLTAWLYLLKIKLHFKHQKVCSLHFKKEDYHYPNPQTDTKGSVYKRLTSIAVPSLNLPVSDEKEERKTQARIESKASKVKTDATMSDTSEQASTSEVQSSVNNESGTKGEMKMSDRSSHQVPNGSQLQPKNISRCQPLSVDSATLGERDINLLAIRAIHEEEKHSSFVCKSESVAIAQNVCVGKTQDSTLNEKDVSHNINLSLLYPKVKMEVVDDSIVSDAQETSLGSLSNDNDMMEVSAPTSATSGVPPHKVFESPPKTFKDIGVQVDDGFSFLKFLKNDHELRAATGLESFKLLGTIVDCVKLVTNNEYEKPTSEMNTEDRVFMTYVKIKHNVPYKFLSVISGSVVSYQQCAKIFIETTLVLSKTLKSTAIPWPSRDTISRNIPLCFEGFEDTRVVLDCLEVFIQQSHNLCCQIQTYSNQSLAHTIKFVIGVTPGLLVSYVSKAYGGRCSCSAIFEQSTLLDMLKSGDAVMVDRNFLIDEVCRKKKIRLIRPSLLPIENPTSRKSLNNDKIAKARTLVKRCTDRIKDFEILGGFCPKSLIPVIEDILTVICGTINLSVPLINDDEFMKD